jgi:hypothetical protein
VKILQITAATKNSDYEHCLQFHPDLKVLYPQANNWSAGTKIKPSVILNHLHMADALLWVDADCSVTLPEMPPDVDFDIGVFDNIVTKHKNRISAAFILFRNNENARHFLRKWQQNNLMHRKDHPALTVTINQTKETYNIVNLSNWLQGCCVVNAYLPNRGEVIG